LEELGMNIVLIRHDNSVKDYLFQTPAALHAGNRVLCNTSRGEQYGTAQCDSIEIGTDHDSQTVLDILVRIIGATLPLKNVVGVETKTVERFADKPAEPAKAEPVKLYCVKDNGSLGIEVTVGKIYEFDADGYIQYDNLKSTHFDSFKDWKRGDFNVANCLVPLVKRPAKVGEWVYITSDDGCVSEIKTGNIYQVKTMASTAGWVRVLSESFGAVCNVRNDKYLVLDGYQPEPKQPEPKQPEPKCWSGKVVCVETGGNFTVGRVYEFKDGKVTDDDGDTRSMSSYRAESLEAWNKLLGSCIARFIEFKGEAHD
jgi:hypothetical protein